MHILLQPYINLRNLPSKLDLIRVTLVPEGGVRYEGVRREEQILDDWIYVGAKLALSVPVNSPPNEKVIGIDFAGNVTRNKVVY